MQVLSDALAEAARNAPHDPGRVTMRRLNRAEYNNTLRDLLGIDLHPADDFPADDVGYGFDNNGDVLSLPPLLLEKYLSAAEKAISLALEYDPTKSEPPQSYRRIMIADPAQLGREAAAQQIVRRFADRAFRRPIADEELNRLMQLFASGDRADQPFAQFAAGAHRDPRQPAISLPRRARSTARRSEIRASIGRVGAGVATVVLPVEQYARR